jgi:glycogen(starch) synthase
VTVHVVRIGSVHELPAHAPDARSGRFDAIGGMQTHTASLTRELADRGLTQTVLTARSWGPRQVEWPRPGVTVHRLGAPVPWLRQGWAVDALRLLPWLRPDVVHAHQGEDVAALPLAAAIARAADVPLVVTVHCSLTHTMQPSDLRGRARSRAGAAAERGVLPRAAAVIALTPATNRHLATWVPAERLHVVPSGVDLDAYRRPRRDPTPWIPRPRILYAGRLAPQKSVPTLVAAFDHLRRPASLVVVGDGPDAAAVASRVSRSARRDAVHLLGPVAHDEVPAHLQHADVLVLPSRYEELGSVLLEALAAGLPTVATRVGGIPWAVADGETGLLVPPGDPAATASALDRLLDDSALRARFAAAARRRAPRFSWPRLAGEVLAVYGRVLDARLPRTAAMVGSHAAERPSPQG